MRPSLLLPLLALGCMPAQAREGAPLYGTPTCKTQMAAVHAEFTTLLAKVAGEPDGFQKAPSTLQRAFYDQQHAALDAAWSLCETVQSGTFTTCEGVTCDPAERPKGTAPLWKLSGVPIYATVDQRITQGGECSIFGSRIDAHNRIPQAGSSDELRRYEVNLRESSSRAAVEACLTLYKGKEVDCEETPVGRRTMLTCK